MNKLIQPIAFQHLEYFIALTHLHRKLKKCGISTNLFGVRLDVLVSLPKKVLEKSVARDKLVYRHGAWRLYCRYCPSCEYRAQGQD